MMRRSFSTALLWCLAAAAAQLSIPRPAVGQAADESLLQAFRARNIGPANMGGRVVDIEAVESDFRVVYVAAASGGVWKSTNAGNTWVPIFDDYPSASIGDIGLFQPNPDIVWVGTGEANNRNSVAWGDGIYKSTDGGRTFVNKGLQSTQQIARVVPHLTDPDRVYVCAIGHLWGYTGDRGLFVTTDGGDTWEKLGGGLPDDGRTGCTDLVMDPADPDVLYAAFYHRLRRPWTFTSGGPNGGIFKSSDGGRTWRKLTAGLPSGETGRIGLAVYRRDPRVVMALVEAAPSDDLARPGSGIYRSEDAGETWAYVNTYNNRPFYYSQLRINPTDDRRVYALTTRFMVSDDGGRTLRNGSEDQEIHGDFHAMWIDPNDGDRYYVGDDKGLHLTFDHGEHFFFLDNLSIAQYYRIGLDMRDPYFVYGGLQDNGTFGGPSFARDNRGILNDYNWKLHWGDGQYIAIDPTDWRTLYTESENGTFRRYDVLTHRYSAGPPTPHNLTNYAAAVPEGQRRGGREFRYNWSAPLVMSPHDPRTLFLGAQYLFRTRDGGETWTIISPDLSVADPETCVQGRSGGITPDNTGAENHCSLTSISPSTITPNVIWVGTDDGNVQVTRNGGATWTNVRPNIPDVPAGIWVGRVEASHHDPAVAYVVFDGHRSDVFTPWVFRTADYGRTWTSLAGNLPDGQVAYVVREDPRNPQLLFLGTEFGLFLSLDGGVHWEAFRNGLPTVAVHDLKVHPRDHDLVIGTHGRGIYIVDDVTPLQQLSPSVIERRAHLFEQRPATLWENTSRGGQRGHFWFAGENPPSVEPASSLPRGEFRNTALIAYYVGGAVAGPVTLEIRDPVRGRVRTVSFDAEAGLHRYRWDLQFDAEPFTAEQVARVEAAFERMMAEAEGFGAQLRRMRDRFRAAQTGEEQRAALRPLLDPETGSGLGEEFAPPVAGPGTYTLRLIAGGASSVSSLTVRADPLLNAPR
jgi:photosystem II stability/assembly factor-like uncharacterized protein